MDKSGISIRENIEKSQGVIPLSDTDQVTQKIKIPKPFLEMNSELWASVKGEKMLVCRQIPFLVKKYNDFENDNVFYELYWEENNTEKRKIISSAAIGIKKELLILTEKGLAVNENNYKRIIDFFDKYLSENQLQQEMMVSRLGHIKTKFIHPALENEIKIVPNDSGEKQILEAFQEKGTVESWKTEVLNLIKPHPKALLYTIASFAAPLLQDFQIDSFIIDFSGHTSQGKTTLLRLASTVWGTQSLINEWNATKVSIERKSAFLNSFPLLMDDTKKARKNEIESIVYQFSGGRSKGRGSIKGFQEDLTWKTIMLSTGESSILEYAKSGGVAGRVVSIVDQPFANASFEYMEQLYKGINNNYGIIGREFINKWLQITTEDKENLVKEFHEIRSEYVKLAGSNEVLVRVAAYYALIHFVAIMLNEMLDFDIDTKLFKELFKVTSKENSAVDKPKQLMEEILESLDAFRSSIHYGDFEPNHINALCDKNNNFYLTTAYVNSFLGAESKATRLEWLKRGYIIYNSKDGKDSQTKKLGGRTYKAIEVNPNLIGELGFDFSDTSK